MMMMIMMIREKKTEGTEMEKEKEEGKGRGGKMEDKIGTITSEKGRRRWGGVIINLFCVLICVLLLFSRKGEDAGGGIIIDICFSFDLCFVIFFPCESRRGYSRLRSS